MKASALKKELKKYVRSEKRDFFPKFFKTGPGEYGEGDKFIGVMVPDIRVVAKNFISLSFTEIEKILQSKIHEERLCALFILVERYKKARDSEKIKIVSIYKKNLKYINGWDLVDLSAPKILGPHYLERDRKQLYTWAKSKNLWKKRIAMLTTFHFIRNNDFTDTLAIAEILVNDEHDLIHKAVGWMLRELGKRDLALEEKFLKKYYKKMPRTMLRYAIEKFPEAKRKKYLLSKI